MLSQVNLFEEGDVSSDSVDSKFLSVGRRLEGGFATLDSAIVTIVVVVVEEKNKTVGIMNAFLMNMLLLPQVVVIG